VASALTTTVPRKPSKFRIDRVNIRRFLFIVSPPVIYNNTRTYYIAVVLHCK
jgi:hypothetical protein